MKLHIWQTAHIIRQKPIIDQCPAISDKPESNNLKWDETLIDESIS